MLVHARSRCGFGARNDPLGPIASRPTIEALLLRTRPVRDARGRVAGHPPANAVCAELTFEQDASV